MKKQPVLNEVEHVINAGNLNGSQENEALKNPAEILNLKKKFPCPDCNKVFKTKRWLENHTTEKKCKMNKKMKKQPVLNEVEHVINEDPSKTGGGTIPPEDQLPKIELATKAVEKTKSLDLFINYFDVFVNVSPVEVAYTHFKYLNTISAYKDVSQNIEIYNIILRGWARKGEISIIQEIWKDLMIKDIKPDLNTYISSMISFSHLDPSIPIYKSVFNQVMYDHFFF